MPITLLPDRQYTAPSAAHAGAITPAGTAWANSAYVTLLAATPAACVLTGVTLDTAYGTGATADYDAEIDLATGAAGSEVVIATVRVGNRRSFDVAGAGPTSCAVLPIGIDNIASGVRLAARLRKNDTNTAVLWKVAITYLQKPITGTVLTTTAVLKTLPPAAAGVTLTAGSPAWANGTWGQLRAAAGSALVLVGLVGSPSAGGEYELDLGTGGAGSETVITTIRLAGNRGFPMVLMLPIPLDQVAATTRLAARIRTDTTSNTLRVSLMVLEQPL